MKWELRALQQYADGSRGRLDYEPNEEIWQYVFPLLGGGQDVLLFDNYREVELFIQDHVESYNEEVKPTSEMSEEDAYAERIGA